MALLAIRKGTTRIVRLSILYNGAALDIRSDTVQFMLKTNKTDLDSAALVNTTADVTTYGASGVALLTLNTAPQAAFAEAVGLMAKAGYWRT